MPEIFVPDSTKEVIIAFGEKEYKFKVKSPTWATVSKVMNACVTFGKDGSFKFDMYKYYRDMLLDIVVESPPEVPISAITLTKLTPEFGQALAKLVPAPGGEEMSFFPAENSESPQGGTGPDSSGDPGS
jgi:hypothetical protein